MSTNHFFLNEKVMRKKSIRGLAFDSLGIFIGFSLTVVGWTIFGLLVMVVSTVFLIWDLYRFITKKYFDRSYSVSVNDADIQIKSDAFTHELFFSDLQFIGFSENSSGEINKVEVQNSLGQKFKFECLNDMARLKELLEGQCMK